MRLFSLENWFYFNAKKKRTRKNVFEMVSLVFFFFFKKTKQKKTKKIHQKRSKMT